MAVMFIKMMNMTGTYYSATFVSHCATQFLKIKNMSGTRTTRYISTPYSTNANCAYKEQSFCTKGPHRWCPACCRIVCDKMFPKKPQYRRLRICISCDDGFQDLLDGYTHDQDLVPVAAPSGRAPIPLTAVPNPASPTTVKHHAAEVSPKRQVMLDD